jgi:uncharacterized damage-inducible protein DinB
MPRLPEDIGPVFERFVRGPGVVREAVHGVGPSTISRPGREGWSIRDVLVHLADAELVRATRIRLILAEDEPALFDFDEGKWKRKLQYLWRSPEASLALFESLRFTSAELLRECDGNAWERAGIHPVDGPLSVRELLARGANHAEEHAAQVRALRTELEPPAR